MFVEPFVVGGSPPGAGPTVALAVPAQASAMAQAARTVMDLMELMAATFGCRTPAGIGGFPKPPPGIPFRPGGGLEAEVPHAELVGAEVVRQLVADGDRDLVAQEVGVVPEVAAQGVAEDDDPVGDVVARGAVALVEAVGADAGGRGRR